MYVFLAVLGLSKYSACLGGLGSGSVSFTWRLKDSQHQRPGPTQRGSCWPPPSPHTTVTNIPWSAINCHHKTQSQAHEGSHEVKVKRCPVKETRLCLPQHGKGARRTRAFPWFFFFFLINTSQFYHYFKNCQRTDKLRWKLFYFS